MAESRARVAEAARLAAEHRAKEEAERKLAAASDNEKILAYVRQIGLIPVPVVSNITSRAIMDNLRHAIVMAESRARA